MEKIRMLYRNYKQHYSDCETVPGSWEADTKSIEVLVPDGRMKPSGVRGQRFHGYILYMADPATQKVYRSSYRAVCMVNAMRQHEKNCKELGLVPCEAPVEAGQAVFM